MEAVGAASLSQGTMCRRPCQEMYPEHRTSEILRARSSIKIAVKIGDHDEAGWFLWGMMASFYRGDVVVVSCISFYQYATVSVSFLCEEIRGQQEYLERVGRVGRATPLKERPKVTGGS